MAIIGFIIDGKDNQKLLDRARQDSPLVNEWKVLFRSPTPSAQQIKGVEYLFINDRKIEPGNSYKLFVDLNIAHGQLHVQSQTREAMRVTAVDSRTHPNALEILCFDGNTIESMAMIDEQLLSTVL